MHGTVQVPINASALKRFFAFFGPGYLVAVGYMDPGNWATDILGGSAYGFKLLSVVLFSNFAAMFLQALCVRLGLVTGRDLAQACRDSYGKPVAIFLWLSAEIGIIACDIAEVIGAGIALKLLFHIPLIIGCSLTALDVVIVLVLQGRGFRWIEGLVIGLIVVMMGIFTVEMFYAHPQWLHVANGFIPSSGIVGSHDELYVALGILGATVMPHNLYLHSSIVQTRTIDRRPGELLKSIKSAILDSNIALFFALFVNAAILIVAAAAFHKPGVGKVDNIEQAYSLLTPLLGAALATPLFAIALLASGQNSTLTGTMAGQIILEGFTDFRMPQWLRRLISRVLAVIPTIIIIALYGDKGSGKLLILSQVILSLQLSFAVIPLVQFTSDRKKMGNFVNTQGVKIAAWALAAIIFGLNVYLVLTTQYS